MNTGRKSFFRMVAGGFTLFLLIYWFMYSGQRFLNACAPVFVGLVIAYPLNIMISFFSKHDPLYRRKIVKSERLHRILCTALAVIVLLGCAAFIAFYMGPQLTACVITLLDRVPSGMIYLLQQPLLIRLIPKETMETLRSIDWSNWINHVVNLVSSDDLFRGMTMTATSALTAVSNVMFGILFACYFLSGRKEALRISRRMVMNFAPESQRSWILGAGRMINECFHNFIVCQAAQALIIGISATLLMHVFGFPYASMVGTLNGFCALIPVVGGYAGAILGTLMILTDDPGMALLFLVFIVVLQNLIGTLVFPRLVGQSLGLPSGWTLAAVLVGSGLGGIMGILIGVPMTAFCYRMIREKMDEKERKAANKKEEGETPSPSEPKPET